MFVLAEKSDSDFKRADSANLVLHIAAVALRSSFSFPVKSVKISGQVTSKYPTGLDQSRKKRSLATGP